jgi:hypothetical protein
VTLSEHRKTLSWKGAIDLGPGLIRIAEEMPASEELGLSLQIRQAMVELPAAIVADLENGTNTRQAVVYKLVASLELVDRVFPALDTVKTKQDVERLVERLSGPDFTERPSAPAPAAAPIPVTPEAHDEPAESPAPAPVPAAEPAEPTVPAPAPAPAQTPEPPADTTHVAVQ